MGKWNEEAQTGLEETVRAWIEWARQELPKGGDIPPICPPDLTRLIFSTGWDSWWKKATAAPWDSRLEDFFDINFKQGAQALSSTFEELDLADLPTRFVALSVCHALAHYEPVLLNEDLASQARDGHKKNLAHLIRLVPIELFDDWRTIRWEILNTHVIRDWDRALALYDRAEKLDLLQLGEIQVLRAQFRFLAALPEDTELSLESLFWPPEVYSRGSFQSEFLFVGGLTPAASTPALPNARKEMLRRAVPDLETALANLNDLSPAYRAVLARCYFLTDHFADAAKQYEKLLSEPLDVFGKDSRGVVYGSAATSLQRDGQAEKAREISERWLRDYPHDPEALRLRAEVEAGASNYKTAYGYLRRLVELRPELQEDLATKIALALGALQGSDKSVDQAAKFLESNLWLASLIDSMEKVHWSCFSELSDQSRSEWRSGLCEIYLFASVVPQDRIRRYENAVKHFAKVVELEIRTRVFDKYRKEVPANNQGLGLPWPGRDRGCTYLHNFLIDRGRLNLDKIIGILEGLTASEDPVAKPFHAWLRETNGKLLKKTSALRSVCGPRGDAAHQEMARDQVGVESVAQSCREVLNSFLTPSPHHASPAVQSPRS